MSSVDHCSLPKRRAFQQDEVRELRKVGGREGVPGSEFWTPPLTLNSPNLEWSQKSLNALESPSGANARAVVLFVKWCADRWDELGETRPFPFSFHFWTPNRLYLDSYTE